MGRYKRLVQSCLLLCTALVAGILTGCAVPPPQDYHETTTKTEFASRIDSRVGYHNTGDRSFVVIDFGNPRRSALSVWLVQIAATDGESVTRSTRIYKGNDSSKQILYQVDRPQEGVSQTFAVELFDEKDRLIMQSEKIVVNGDLAEGK